MWTTFINFVGLCAFLNFLYISLKSPIQLGYHKLLECSGKSLSLRERYGQWAAITGSTDGIGKAYAIELARRGLNIVLISRSQTKLEKVANEIENECGVETFIIQTDFAKGAEVYEHLFNELAKRPIGIIVNNVGIGHNPPGRLSSYTHQHITDMIHINVMAATLISRHFVDKWIRSGYKGCIVNVSSDLEMNPVPYAAVYGGSKAFLRSFTLALQHEVKQFGITVQLVSPAFVVTKINAYSDQVMRGGHILIPQAEEYAKWAVNSLGKSSVTSGYFWHGVQATIIGIIPSYLRSKLVVQLAKVLVNDLSNINKSQ